MATNDYPLNAKATAIADSTGKAVARLGPRRFMEVWEIDSFTVESTSSTLVPTCRVRRGSDTGPLLDGTWSGQMDTSDKSVRLLTNSDLVAVWTGCDVGSTCTLTVDGTVTGRR